MIRKNNKKALSEIVSYVILIVIAMALAAGVYSWMKFYVPAEKETCSENIALSMSEYNCDQTNKILTLTLTNLGYFNIDGFISKATNDSTKIPATMINMAGLSGAQMVKAVGAGRYDFNLAGGASSSTLKNQEFKTVSLDYMPLGSIKKLQIQPYVKANKTKGILLCNPITISLENCN